LIVRLLLLILFVSSACAASKIKLVLTHIPKVMEYERHDAPYNKLVAHLVVRFPHAFEYEFMPSSRGNKLLNSRQIDCLFPIIPLQTRTVKTQLSAPVNGISAYLFSLGPETYRDLNELEGKMIVYLRGYLFGGLVERHPELNFFAVTNQQAALGMLEKQRAHAYLDYLPDIRFVFDEVQLSKLKYDTKFPVVRDSDRFECIETRGNTQFLTQINREITELRRTGQLQKILGKYYVSVD